MDSLVLSRRGSTRMALGSYAEMTIIYLFPLLNWIVNHPILSECIFPDGISGWLIVA